MSQTSSRLSCRSTTPADLEFVLATERADGSADFVLQWSAQQHLAALDDANVAHWILDAEGVHRRAVGFVILAGIDPPGGSVEFKRIVVAEKGSGFGREAVRVVKREVFERYRAHRLWLDVFEHNQRARALYTSEGFTAEGMLREHVKWQDQWRSLVLMSMLSREYVSSLHPTEGSTPESDTKQRVNRVD
jgi:diamine N-acetyltransferase